MRYKKTLNELLIDKTSLEKRLNLQEKIHKEGIKYRDMKVENLVQTLWEVDQIEIDEMVQRDVRGAYYEGTKRLWNLIGKYYGQEYFMDIIEDQYGISAEKSNSIDRQISDMLYRCKKIHEERLDKMNKTYQDEILQLKKEIRSRNEDINSYKRKLNSIEFQTSQSVIEKLNKAHKESDLLTEEKHKD